MNYLAVIACLLCLTSTAAMGLEPMSATVRVSSGPLYDYVVIGEHPKASNGFDNVYDTVWPGNLNADMGQPYLSAVVIHPEWKSSQQELRGDIRAPAKRQEWQLSVSSSLPKGTPLAVGLLADRSRMPKGIRLSFKNDTAETDLRSGAGCIPAPGPGSKSNFTIIAEQP